MNARGRTARSSHSGAPWTRRQAHRPHWLGLVWRTRRETGRSRSPQGASRPCRRPPRCRSASTPVTRPG